MPDKEYLAILYFVTRSPKMKAMDDNIFNTPEKRRCRDCACLVEGEDGTWVCDAVEADIHEISRCFCDSHG